MAPVPPVKTPLGFKIIESRTIPPNEVRIIHNGHVHRIIVQDDKPAAGK